MPPEGSLRAGDARPTRTDTAQGCPRTAWYDLLNRGTLLREWFRTAIHRASWPAGGWAPAEQHYSLSTADSACSRPQQAVPVHPTGHAAGPTWPWHHASASEEYPVVPGGGHRHPFPIALTPRLCELRSSTSRTEALTSQGTTRPRGACHRVTRGGSQAVPAPACGATRGTVDYSSAATGQVGTR